MDGLARVRQPEREQVAGHQLASQLDRDVPEVDFGLGAGLVGLRDERVHDSFAGLQPDLFTAASDVCADHLVGDVDGVVLVQQPVVDPLDGVPLLPRRGQIRREYGVDHRPVGVQPRFPRTHLLPRLRHRRDQSPLHGLEADAVLPHERPQRHAGPGVTADRRVQIDLGLWQHPSPLVVQSTTRVPNQAPGRSRNSATSLFSGTGRSCG